MWTAERKYRALLPGSSAPISSSGSPPSVPHHKQVVKYVADFIARGAYGAVYLLQNGRALKIEKLDPDRDVFKEGAALSSSMGEEGIGPRVYEACATTELVLVMPDDTRHSLADFGLIEMDKATNSLLGFIRSQNPRDGPFGSKWTKFAEMPPSHELYPDPDLSARLDAQYNPEEHWKVLALAPTDFSERADLESHHCVKSIKYERVFYRPCASLAKVSKLLGLQIDRMCELGIVCSDMKPDNVLVLHDGPHVSKVYLSDFDKRFCCRYDGSSPSLLHACKDAPSIKTEHVKLALKTQLCWTTILHTYPWAIGRPLIFEEEARRFLELCADRPEMLQHLTVPLQSFHHYTDVDLFGKQPEQERTSADWRNAVSEAIRVFAHKIAPIENPTKIHAAIAKWRDLLPKHTMPRRFARQMRVPVLRRKLQEHQDKYGP